MPPPPQLKALQNAPSGVLANTGSHHTYAPVVEASGDTSYELAPLFCTHAHVALSPSDPIDFTPIPRSQSSPVLALDSHIAEYLLGCVGKSHLQENLFDRSHHAEGTNGVTPTALLSFNVASQGIICYLPQLGAMFLWKFSCFQAPLPVLEVQFAQL